MSFRLPLLAALLSAASVPAQEGKRAAICVGVNHYHHAKLDDLKYAEADATEMRDVLKAAGYETLLYTGAEGAKNAVYAPTRRNIEAGVQAVLMDAGKRDMVVIALAGHGVCFEKTKEAYFCPVDAKPFDDEADTLISLSGLFSQMDKSGAGVKFLLVDACRNDPKAGRGRGAAGDIAPKPPVGTVALYSCKDGERAYESDKYRHGVFFHHVLPRCGATNRGP